MAAKIPINHGLSLLFLEICGMENYYNFKEYGTISDFKKQYVKLLNILRKAVKDNILVCDQYHIDDMFSTIKSTIQDIKECKSVDAINCSLICFFTRFSFLLLGMKPKAPYNDRSRNAKNNRKLDFFRSIQYVQTKEQKDRLDMDLVDKNCKT